MPICARSFSSSANPAPVGASMEVVASFRPAHSGASGRRYLCGRHRELTETDGSRKREQ